MNNIADGGYASFVTSYYETVLLKNDTQKTVAALFSATERKICEVCDFRYFDSKTVLLKNETQKTVAALFSDIERKICEVCAFRYFYSKTVLLKNETQKTVAAEKRIVHIFFALYYKLKELRPSNQHF